MTRGLGHVPAVVDQEDESLVAVMYWGWSSGKKPLAFGMTATAQPSASARSRNASIARSADRRCGPAIRSGFFARASRAVARSTAESNAWELPSAGVRMVSNGPGSAQGAFDRLQAISM